MPGSFVARSTSVEDLLYCSDPGPDDAVEEPRYFVSGDGDETLILVQDPLFSSVCLMIVRKARATIDRVMCPYHAV